MTQSYTRRRILKTIAVAPFVSSISNLTDADAKFTARRPRQSERKFISRAVEEIISAVKAKIADPELAWMFENCYPNTLDTTVTTATIDGRPDTFVITGDIDAM